MRIALTGEGATDYGRRDYKTREWSEGPIQQYMREIARENGYESIEFEVLPKEDVQKVRVQQRSLKQLKHLDGHAILARKFTVWMQEQQLTKGVYYCDADREGGSKNNAHAAKKRFEELYHAVQRGLEGTDGIPAIPLRMIECWILGDKVALQNALKIKITDKEKPKAVELLWGDKYDPNSNYPKHYLKRLVRTSGNRYKDFEGNQKDFVEIAKCANTETMRSMCPISYGKFYDDFIEMLNKE